MKNFIIWDRIQGRYISFSATDSKSRVGALYLSNVYNKTGKFKVLEDLHTDNVITMNGETKQIRDILLKVKHSGKKSLQQ